MAYVRACPKARAGDGQPTKPKLPPLRKRLETFALASIQHAAAGSPTLDDAGIQARPTICQGCEHFIRDKDNDQIGHCAQCGCSTNLQKFLNKLAWAEQKCPLDKWPAVG